MLFFVFLGDMIFTRRHQSSLFHVVCRYREADDIGPWPWRAPVVARCIANEVLFLTHCVLYKARGRGVRVSGGNEELVWIHSFDGGKKGYE